MRFLTLEAQSYRCRKFKDDFAKQNCAATQRTESSLFYAGNSSYLSMVHEVEKASHVVFVHIAQDDDGMLAGVALQGKHKMLRQDNFFWPAGGSITLNNDDTLRWECKICMNNLSVILTSLFHIRPRIEQGTYDFRAADSYHIL